MRHFETFPKKTFLELPLKGYRDRGNWPVMQNPLFRWPTCDFFAQQINMDGNFYGQKSGRLRLP